MNWSKKIEKIIESKQNYVKQTKIMESKQNNGKK